MNAKRQPGIGPGIDRSKNVEDLHHLRLMSLLDELVQAKGVMRAARELNVNYRTLAAAKKSGRLSRRMRGALGQRLMEGGGSPAREQRQRNDELAGRLEKVEVQVESVGTEASQGLTDVQGEVQALRSDYTRDLQRVESRQGKATGEDGAAGSPSPSRAGNGSFGRALPRRDFPDLATLDPAEDDERVFGDAWPLVQEWRELRDNHPNQGKGAGVAARRGAPHVRGAGAAGGARPDPSAPDLSPQGPGPGRPDQLAPEGPGGRPPRPEKAGKAPVAAVGADRGALAQVVSPKGPVPFLLTLCRWGAQDLPRDAGTGDNIYVVWLFQCFPP